MIFSVLITISATASANPVVDIETGEGEPDWQYLCVHRGGSYVGHTTGTNMLGAYEAQCLGLPDAQFSTYFIGDW